LTFTDAVGEIAQATGREIRYLDARDAAATGVWTPEGARVA